MRLFACGWNDGFDGPGRRWVLYLKGCNFRCRWCANPEGLRPEPEIMFYAERPDMIAEACPRGAVTRLRGEWHLDRRRCQRCSRRSCATVWKHPAFAWAGEELSPAEIARNAEAYRPLFGGNGGVTFTGGEPMLQAEEVLAAARRLRKLGIHTALATNAALPCFPQFLDKIDLMLCDLKCVSPERHRAWTGADNAATLAHLEAAARHARGLVIRIPLVPGFNGNREERSRIAAFLRRLIKLRPKLAVEVLRMHHLAEPKYRALGLDYPMAGVDPPSPRQAECWTRDLQRQGIAAVLAFGRPQA